MDYQQPQEVYIEATPNFSMPLFTYDEGEFEESNRRQGKEESVQVILPKAATAVVIDTGMQEILKHTIALSESSFNDKAIIDDTDAEFISELYYNEIVGRKQKYLL